ncbi:ATP-dependent Clp protease ATP-binding subunit ClpC [Synergistales bacterium]|nr:ATP-dependent Clp protease ATP-binding subunit ClpC [Synergistales bacterium]
MWQFFNEKGKKVVQTAHKEALRLGHEVIGTEHLLLGILNDPDPICSKIFEGYGITPDDIRARLDAAMQRGEPIEKGIDLPLSERAKRALDISMREARSMRLNYVGVEHVLLGLVSEGGGLAAQILAGFGMNISQMRKDIQSIMSPPGELQFAGVLRARPDENEHRPNNSKTPAINQMCVDLSEMARNGSLDPITGRDKEMSRLTQILMRRTKNNPVLIGHPGVGKTAVVEGLALKIVNGEVPEILKDLRIVQLNMANIVAGTKYRGEFEERMRRILKELRESKDIILFIDEIHTVVGAGAAEGSVDAANILKHSLARGEVQVIGATTLDEFSRHIEKDSALERRFQPIIVDEPSEEDTVLILHGLRESYEAHHKVRYDNDALTAAVKLSGRYIPSRYLPDKAIDLIDEAAARVRLGTMESPEDLKEMERRLDDLRREKESAVVSQEFELAANLRDEEKNMTERIDERRREWQEARDTLTPEVTVNDIATVVCEWTGIPVTQMTEAENARIRRIDDELHKRIVGQDEAVTAVSRAIRRSRSGIRDAKRPVGSFLFLGPTGVGKTELAKSLAEFLFGSEGAMLRFDMSEFVDRHEVSKLIGAPPGYVGYDKGGKLTDAVRRKPYSVILFDEIEKAHPDVYNILLQMMEDGCLTDAFGRKVDFKNTVIILTSNVGSKHFLNAQPIGFGLNIEKSATGFDWERVKSEVMDDVKRVFRPEMLNRIDDTVIFKPLDRDDLIRVTDIMLALVADRAAEQKIEISVDSGASSLILDKGFDPKYGARPLRRMIQRMVEDKLSDMILDGSLAPGDKVCVTAAVPDSGNEGNGGTDALELRFDKQEKADGEEEADIDGDK